MKKICRLAYGEVFLVSIIVLFYLMGYLQENDAKFRSSLEFNPSVKKMQPIRKQITKLIM